MAKFQEKDYKYIQELFPQILEIKEEEIRRKVAEVWLEMLKRSTWKRIEDLPYDLDDEEATLVEHVRAVTRCGIEFANITTEAHGISVNYDYLIAGLLLHDVSKPVEYEKRDGKLVRTELRDKLPHAYYGAHVALEAGLPLEIAHLIISHTLYSPVPPKSIEGLIIHYIDYADAEMLFWRDGKGSIVSKLHKSILG